MRGQVDSVYMDFNKAYDMVNHSLIIKKMIELGVPNYLVKFIKDYLCNRNTAIKINQVLSKEFDLPRDIPQGSHLGPILFIIFINDIIKVISFAKILLYIYIL